MSVVLNLFSVLCRIDSIVFLERMDVVRAVLEAAQNSNVGERIL